jgi:hypothetical protein
MAPATSDAIAIPIPTVSPALSTIVFSTILIPLSLYADTQLRIVEAYRSKHTSLLLPLQIVAFRYLAGAPLFPQTRFRPTSPRCGRGPRPGGRRIVSQPGW